MTFIDPNIARFVSDFGEMWQAFLDERYDDKLSAHGPLGLTLTGVNGVIARFYEYDIDFYPKEEK